MGTIKPVCIADLPEFLLIKPGSKIKLSKHKPGFTTDDKKSTALGVLEKNTTKIAELQRMLSAQKENTLLIILQGMSTAGKDGAIRGVLGKTEPQGHQVTHFKEPTSDELEHDFLWRIHKHIPPKGTIGIFNRSHYEDVLEPKVKDEISKEEIEKRYRQINDFERMISENGVKFLKFFLYIGKKEREKRLAERGKEKPWKLTKQDFKEGKLWDKYIEAYEDTINNCTTEWAPWYIIPANYKWFRNLAISEIVLKTLKEMRLEYPESTAFEITS